MLVSYDMYDVGFTWYTLCWSKLISMILITLDMKMYKLKDNASDPFVSLLGLGRVMGLQIQIALVDLDCGYE